MTASNTRDRLQGARRPPVSLSQGRTRARRAALQALYQWKLGRQELEAIEAQFLTEQDMRGVDLPYFRELLHRIPACIEELDGYLAALLERSFVDVDPVEMTVLRIGAYELAKRPDIPYRVVISEALELTKRFGAEQGHRFVNGVLDRLARQLRAAEPG